MYIERFLKYLQGYNFQASSCSVRLALFTPWSLQGPEWCHINRDQKRFTWGKCKIWSIGLMIKVDDYGHIL